MNLKLWVKKYQKKCAMSSLLAFGSLSAKQMEIRTECACSSPSQTTRSCCQPVHSFTDKLAGVTAKSFGESAEEIQKPPGMKAGKDR